MNALAITTLDDRTAYAPGETILGSVGWDMEREPRSAELRLFWHTQGKGDRDTQVVQRVQFDAPQARDTRDFTIELPDRPYSFSGRLVSLIWSLELIVTPGGSRLLELTVSPTGQEVSLLDRPGGDT